MPTTPDCFSCGACCFSRLDTYVRVTGDDHRRLGDAADSVSVFIGNRCYLRMLDDRCAQLAIDAQGRFVCSIYERRPEICRSLEPGSSECAGERERKAHVALRAAATDAARRRRQA